MSEELIPGEIRDFIQRHIDSVAQLEALLLLRANPTESWGQARTAKRLYTTEQEISEVLTRLCAAIAFGLDSVTRLVLALSRVSDEAEPPFIYRGSSHLD